MASESKNGGKRQDVASRSTLLVTNVTKLAGLAVGLHQGFAATPDPRVIALAAFMVAGGQIGENVLIAVIERFFGMKSGGGK